MVAKARPEFAPTWPIPSAEPEGEENGEARRVPVV
jgi:hypothetical protein